MSHNTFVHLLPSLLESEQVRGQTAVIVDVLRASTTISHALAAGASGVVPCESVDDALQLRHSDSTGQYLLGGERGGIRIEGFELSNSPADYGSEVVEGRMIGFTTTNGTRALLKARQARSVVVAAFVNLSAVVDRILTTADDIHIVCAGTNGAVTGEDVLFAGALVSRLIRRIPETTLSDSAAIAFSHWQNQCSTETPDIIEASLRRSQGGRNLTALGYDQDIATAAAVDSVRVAGSVCADGIVRSHPPAV